MTKERILKEIRRVAANDGPPGRQAFERATGIRMAEWYPHLWLRWGDALAEAGYAPKTLQQRVPDENILERYVLLVRDLGHLPVEGEIRRKARSDKGFPSHTSFRRFGGRAKLLEAVVNYCAGRDDLRQVGDLAAAGLSHSAAARLSAATDKAPPTGFVYLMRSGRHYGSVPIVV